MLKKSFASSLAFTLASFCISISAQAQSQTPKDQIGVGTEINLIRPAAGAIYFNQCKYDPRSSCAVFSKVDKTTGKITEGKRCTMLVSNHYVSIMDFKEGKKRVFRVTKVGRDFDEVKSLVLEGDWKHPIILTCQGETIDDGITSLKNRVTITKSGLRGFKEFELGTVKYHKEDSTPSVQKAKPAERQGSSQ